MANQLLSLLQHWYPQRDSCDWVLGTIYKTEGPCYRKAGAMMLFNSLGQQFGLLSGGCLESDIQIHARKVMQSGDSVSLTYDGSDEDDVSFHLGIGCGGKVYLMLQPITVASDYLGLGGVLHRLKKRQTSMYYQCIPEEKQSSLAFSELATAGQFSEARSCITSRDGVDWLVTAVRPEPHVLLVGGGVDAQPLLAIAKQLGWMVSIWDPRPANARKEHFMQADRLLKCPVEDLPGYVAEAKVDAAILMTHNVVMDAAALAQLDGSLGYIALLGPLSRKQQVLRQAGLKEELLRCHLHGPAGFDIGGDLPESIAVSILSQCHQVLYKGEQLSMKHGLAA